MHMLAVTLACTYQNSLPILTYSDQYVKNLHRFHLRHYVTGQLGTDTIDWLAGFITLLQQPGRGTRDYTPPPVRPSAGGATLHRTYSETPAQDIFQGLTNWKRTTNKRKSQKESKILTRKRELATTTGTETYEPVPRNIRKSRRLLKEDTHTENTDTCTDTNISTNTTRGNQTRKKRTSTRTNQKASRSGTCTRTGTSAGTSTRTGTTHRSTRTGENGTDQARISRPPLVPPVRPVIPLRTVQTTLFQGRNPAIPIVTDYYSQEYEYEYSHEACDTELKAARSQPDARNGTVQDDPVPVRLQANSSITAHDTARVLQPHTSTGTGVRVRVQQKDKDKYSRTIRTTSSTLNEGSRHYGESGPPTQPGASGAYAQPPLSPPLNCPRPPRLGTPCPSPSLPSMLEVCTVASSTCATSLKPMPPISYPSRKANTDTSTASGEDS